MSLEEGWYLMSTPELERELARFRGADLPASGAIRLSIDEALAYRAAGNLPDSKDRTLRLVLHIAEAGDLTSLDSKRLLYEPDYHDPPVWRREGSKPVNVVPLRSAAVAPETADPWWERPELKELEDEWSRSGTVHGVPVPAAYRGFVYKTALSLRAAGIEVSAETLADSISRWVAPDDAERIRAALTSSGR
ncbi:MAG TPA: hypothetical protein VE889_06995 [Actinomycetota bacterium]|nr:hypothetical protein [Actinomycetota bacterium]